jgi:hypothetical protein
MSYVFNNLLLHLHAALANGGRSPATNNPPITQWFDLSRNGRNANLQGFNFNSDQGWVGTNAQGEPYSLYFNGSGNKLVVQNSTGLLPYGDFAYQARIKPLGGTDILRLGGETQQGFSLYLNSNFELIGSVRTPTDYATFNFGVVTPNEWVDIILSYDSSSKRLWGFLDGAPQGFVLAQSGTYNTHSSSLEIGNGFKGYISIVRVYNKFLDFEEVSLNASSEMYLHDHEDDLPTNGIVPWRLDIPSEINISITARATANYDIICNDSGNLVSEIEVAEPKDLESSLNVRPIFRLTGNYDISTVGFGELNSYIEVTHFTELPSTLAINVQATVTAHYDIDWQEIVDLPSEINVHAPHLTCSVSVNVKEVSMRANYNIRTYNESDLVGSISVTKFNDLPSLVGVNPSARAVAKYGVEGIHVYDTPSTIDVNAVSNLPSSLTVIVSTYMTARYGAIDIEVSDLPSELIIPSLTHLTGSLYIPIASKLTARYSVTPLYLYDVPSTLGIAEFSDLPADMFINFEAGMSARYNVEPIYFAHLDSVLSISEVSDLPSSLLISPQISMRASYDVVERPSATQTLIPVKDAFVRESLSRLNYGTEVQVYVGKTASPQNERFRSYISFDLSTIPTDNTEVGKAILRVYFDGRSSQNLDVMILEATESWSETGITWASQPFPVMAFYNGHTAVATVGTNQGYIEFDVTAFVKDWHEGKKPNTGFILKAVDETINVLKGFYSKESVERRPELVVTYYDKTIFELDDSSILGDLTVVQSKNKDLVGNIEIKQYKQKSDLNSDVIVKLPGDLYSIIWVSRPELTSLISVAREDYSEILSDIAVREQQISELPIEIKIHEPNKPGNIYVLYRDDILADITVRVWNNPWVDGSQLASDISISETNKLSEIYVKYYFDVVSEISIRQWVDDSDSRIKLPSDLEVTRSFELKGQLNISEPSDLGSNVSIRTWGEADQLSSVYILHRNDLPIYGNVSNPDFKAFIEVWEKSLLDGFIAVRKESSSAIPSNIKVPLGDKSDLPANITLIKYRDVPGSVIVRSGNLAGSITIPINGKKDTLSILAVREKRIDDLLAIIDIASGNLYSEISVRVEGNKDIQTNLSVRSTDNSNLNSDVDILYRYSVSSFISVRRSDFKWTFGWITVRQSDNSDLLSDVTVRVWNDPWNDGGQLDGSISVRVIGWNDKVSNIAIRRDAQYDQDSYISVWRVDDLHSDMSVRQIGKSDLHSSIAIYELYELFSDIAIRRWGDPWTDGGQLNSYITVRQYAEKDLSGNVEVFNFYDVPSSIAARQSHYSNLASTISIRTWGWKDLSSTIAVRQKNASDLHTIIFAVRQSGKNDLTSTAIIYRVSDLNGSIEVITSYPYAFIM